MLLCILISFIFKLNKFIALLGSNVSFPPLIPLVIYSSIKTGELITGVNIAFDFDSEFDFSTLKNHALVYGIGSIVLAVFSGFFSFLLIYLTLKIFGRLKLK